MSHCLTHLFSHKETLYFYIIHYIIISVDQTDFCINNHLSRMWLQTEMLLLTGFTAAEIEKGS